MNTEQQDKYFVDKDYNELVQLFHDICELGKKHPLPKNDSRRLLTKVLSTMKERGSFNGDVKQSVDEILR